MTREWDIKRTTFSLGDFVSWQKAQSLELSPSFQRRNVWTAPQKSYFIDTVFRGLPVPIVFLRERTDVESLTTVREVVDGQQRLRTALSFIDPTCLKDFSEKDDFVVQTKHNAELAGKKFSKLNTHEKSRILSYQMSVHVLPSDTSDAEVLSIFARMNSTGSKLNDQELRNAYYFGEFKICSYEIALANLYRWRNWGIFSEQDIARMKEVEFTSSLFIVLLGGLFERTQPNINRYYKNLDDKFPKKDEIVKQFSNIMTHIDESFGSTIGSSVFSNSAMFLQLFFLVKRLLDLDLKITRPRMRIILDLGEKIKSRKDIPANVSVALESRFNRLSNQIVVSDFLFEHASK